LFRVFTSNVILSSEQRILTVNHLRFDSIRIIPERVMHFESQKETLAAGTPKAFHPSAQGCEERAALGHPFQNASTLNGLHMEWSGT
jgi:hypothetical protein